MKKVRTILLFLLAGAVVNFAVTWFIAFRLHEYGPSDGQSYSTRDGPTWLFHMADSPWGSTAIWAVAWPPNNPRLVGLKYGRLPSWSRMHEPPTTNDWRGSSFAVAALDGRAMP